MPLCWEFWGNDLLPSEIIWGRMYVGENDPTLNVLRFVDAPHVLQNVAVEGLGQLCRHGCVEVRLVAFQHALQRELAHTQHLVVQIHDALAPRTAILICKQPQVQDFAYPKNKGREKKDKVKESACLRTYFSTAVVLGGVSHVVCVTLGVLRWYSEQDTQTSSYGADLLISHCRKSVSTAMASWHFHSFKR